MYVCVRARVCCCVLHSARTACLRVFRYRPLEFVFDENVLTVFPGQTLAVAARPLEPAPISWDTTPLQACVSTFTGNLGAPVCKAVVHRTGK